MITRIYRKIDSKISMESPNMVESQKILKVWISAIIEMYNSCLVSNISARAYPVFNGNTGLFDMSIEISFNHYGSGATRDRNRIRDDVGLSKLSAAKGIPEKAARAFESAISALSNNELFWATTFFPALSVDYVYVIESRLRDRKALVKDITVEDYLEYTKSDMFQFNRSSPLCKVFGF